MKCMDINMIDEYVSGELSGREKDLAEKHLSDCDKCLEAVALGKILLRDIESAEYAPLSEKLIRAGLENIFSKVKKVFNWFTELSPPEWLLLPEISHVRSGNTSSSAPCIFVKQYFSDMLAEIYIEKQQNNRTGIWIKILKNNNKNEKNICVTLIREDGTPFARFLKQDYVFFDKLHYGVYCLTLEQNSFTFEINDAGLFER
ncbi:MAG: zf-HC2 domain-containing protein [Desulfobacterales bacterium]|nr:zf-HC2 domain-containing protein [Desulfobacterales bacterium]